MYEDIAELNKVIHERMRLAMMTLLYYHREVSFNYLKEALKTSEGNLANHPKVLEKSGYIKVKKRFVKRRPQTSYELTELGKEAYRRYLSVLKRLLDGG